MSENQGEGAGNASYDGGADNSGSGQSQSDSAGFGPPASAAPQGPPASAVGSSVDRNSPNFIGPPESAKPLASKLQDVWSGVSAAAYNIGQVGLLTNPATGPFALASKVGAVSTLGNSISNFFSGLNTNYGGTFGGSSLSNSPSNFTSGYSSGSKNSGFSFSTGNASTVNDSIASAGGAVVSGLAPSSAITAYSSALDSTVSTAKTNTGGTLQAVAPTQSKAGDSSGTLATLAALASIFAVFKA